MMKRTVSGLLLAVCVFGLAACKPKKPAGAAQAGEEWYRYISAFTSGAVSRKSTVRVLFVDDAAAPGPAAAGLLEFSPALAGKAEWRSPRELVFTPRDEMKPGQDYKAVLRVGKVLDLPKAYARFAFGFSVIRPNLEVDVDGLFAEDPDRPQSQVLRGHVVTADAEESVLVEKVLGAEQGGRTLTIEWSHAPLGLVHAFAVRGIERGEEASAVALEWDGGPIRIDNRGRRAYEVPAKGEFKVVSIEPVLGETRHVLVRFSDALAADQSLKGLLVVEDHPLTFEIEGNVVRAYSSRELVGSVDVQVLSGIRNLLDRRLAEGLDRQITFESIRPQVRFVGRGLVLPRRDRLTVPIEAVNLKSVQVAAFQIYPGNMAQFFQVNSLEGGEELARVGRYLWRKTVPLSDDQAVTGKWSRYDLDVTPLFKENPGSLFRIVLSMNRGNSTYPCPPSDAPVVVEPPVKNMDDLGYGRWANWDYDDEGYDYGWGEWRNRDNPCSDAYFLPRYNREAVAGRNFFASDIGLVAKLEAGGTLRVVTTDIGTARPLSGLKVRAYNYQNRLLGETASDGNGFAVLALEDRPFYVSAEGGGDIGYLRVSSEGVLALSHFDVGGEITQKGVKGIVYGERGVWRPGDTLHLTFALFDRDEVLPEGHPVLMELYSPQGQLVGTPQAREDRRAVLRLPRRDGRGGPHRQLAGPRPRRRPDLREDPQDRDGRAQPAQDRPRRRAGNARPQGHALRGRRHGPVAPRRAGGEPEIRRVGPPVAAGDPVRPLPGLRLRRPGPRLRGRHGRGGRGRPRRRRQGPGPDRHQAAAAQPGPARRRLHQPRLRGERRLQRRHLLPALPSLRFLCRRPRTAGRPGPGPARDRQGPPGRHRHRRSLGPARLPRQGRRLPLPDRVAVVVGAERRVARPVRLQRPDPADRRVHGLDPGRRRALDVQDPLSRLGPVPGPGRGPRERPRHGPDRLRRLAGLGRTGPRGGRPRGDRALLHRRQAVLQGRREGRHLPARGRPGPGPGLHRERDLGPRHDVGAHGQGREPLRDPAHGGHGAQRLCPRHAPPAAPGQDERRAHPALRRHPAPRRGPGDEARAGDQDGRRDQTQGKIQGRGPGERRPADVLHAGRRRRGPARPDPVRDARPAQGLLQPRGPRRPDLGPLRSRGRGLRGRDGPHPGYRRRRERRFQGQGQTAAPVPAGRPVRWPVRAQGGRERRPRIDDAAVLRGGPGHGRGRTGRRVRLGGEVRAGPP